MADHTISETQGGVYQVTLPADAVQSVAVAFRGVNRRTVEVIHHGGDEPLYVGRTAGLADRDPAALVMVMPGTGEEFDMPTGATLYLRSAAAAVYTVRKS